MQAKGRIHWTAVLSGYLLDFVISAVVSLIAFNVDPELSQQGLFSSAGSMVVGLLLSLATITGGWVAGRIAKDERFFHGFMVGGVGVVLALLSSVTGDQLRLDDILRHLVATLLGGVAGYLSGGIPVRQREK